MPDDAGTPPRLAVRYGVTSLGLLRVQRCHGPALCVCCSGPTSSILIRHPNRKVYIGLDRTDTVTYFGGVHSHLVAADFTPEEIRGCSIRKQVLWESPEASRGEVVRVEADSIRRLRSNDPEVGAGRVRWGMSRNESPLLVTSTSCTMDSEPHWRGKAWHGVSGRGSGSTDQKHPEDPTIGSSHANIHIDPFRPCHPGLDRLHHRRSRGP